MLLLEYLALSFPLAQNCSQWIELTGADLWVCSMGHLSGVGNADSRDHYSFVQHSLALFTLLSCHSPSCCDQRLFSNSGSFDMIDCSRSEISDKSLGADGLLTQRGCTGSSGAFPAWCIYENQNPKKQPLQRSPCAPPEPFQLNSPPPVARVGHELLHGCSQREIVCVCACVCPSPTALQHLQGR